MVQLLYATVDNMVMSPSCKQRQAGNMVQMLYARVDNMVMSPLNLISTKFIMVLIKQGCVLSPCLCNLVIAVLDSMLNGNRGVEIGPIRIRLSGLCYTDDIVLFTEDMYNLRDMCYIADIADVFVGNGRSYSMTKGHKSQVL